MFTAVDSIRNVKANDGQESNFYNDHASSHKCGVLKAFLASKRVVVVNHPPYSHVPMTHFYLQGIQNALGKNRYNSRRSLRSAISLVSHRGSYMSVHLLFNLLNELGKRDKMRGLPSILSLFRDEFNKFNNTRARMLDFIYHMTLRSL